MNSTIEKSIKQAEERWLEKLEELLQQLFSNTFLPSHSTAHHLRTWHNAARLLRASDHLRITIPYDFVEAVLLTSMLHDAGMCETREVQHGSRGKEIYLEWIASSGIPKPPLHDAIAGAIELHDRKTDRRTPFRIGQIPDLLTVVHIADDLDALGVIGIYRYAEIYLHRQVPLSRLGYLIIENVEVRYRNFTEVCALFPDLISEFQVEFEEITGFYNRFNKQVAGSSQPELITTGEAGIINFIRDYSVLRQTDPQEYSIPLTGYQGNEPVFSYFQRLQEALASSSG